MKNIPHQFAQIPKFEAALKVFEQLAHAGRDLSNDSVVGEAFARAGVHKFREQGARSIEEMLLIERNKPAASRGTYTCARDMRHFFKLLKFLSQNEENSLELTQTATALLINAGAGARIQADAVWRQALLGLETDDASGRSHPYQILLRLLAIHPGLPRYAAGLCLEAKDDSEREFRRIRAIANRPNVQQAIRQIAGEYKADNAAKVLPSLAIQLGDAVEVGGRLYLSSAVLGTLEMAPRRKVAHGGIGSLVRRPFTPRQRNTLGNRRPLGKIARAVVINPDLLAGRFNAHQDCLDRFSARLNIDSSKYEANYDLLIAHDIESEVLLVEAKTLRDDAPLQTRMALGQLEYYEYFDVRPHYPQSEISSLMLTDQPLPKQLGSFLTEHGVGAVWVPVDGASGGTELGKNTTGRFGFSWTA